MFRAPGRRWGRFRGFARKASGILIDARPGCEDSRGVRESLEVFDRRASRVRRPTQCARSRPRYASCTRSGREEHSDPVRHYDRSVIVWQFGLAGDYTLGASAACSASTSAAATAERASVLVLATVIDPDLHSIRRMPGRHRGPGAAFTASAFLVRRRYGREIESGPLIFSS